MNQVDDYQNGLDIYYDKVGLVLMEKFVVDSKQPIGMVTNALVFKLELL